MRGYERRSTWFIFFNAYKLHKELEKQQNQRITLKRELSFWARRQNLRRYETHSISDIDIALLDTINFDWKPPGTTNTTNDFSTTNVVLPIITPIKKVTVESYNITTGELIGRVNNEKIVMDSNTCKNQSLQ